MVHDRRAAQRVRSAFPVNQPGNDDGDRLYGTWPPEKLAAIACATLAGIGVQLVGIFAARPGFSV